MASVFHLAKPFLFALDPERAHDLALLALGAAAATPLKSFFSLPHCPREVMGLPFPNPVGIAAGFDKAGKHTLGLGLLGAGFVEVGTLTLRPQKGHPRPRLFRLEKDQALINRMGFNNPGVRQAARDLKKSRYPGMVGVSLGPGKDTEATEVLFELRLDLEAVREVADFAVVNISSPNTPGLRALIHPERLAPLVRGMKKTQEQIFQDFGKRIPLAFKISPDASDADIAAAANVLIQEGADGIVAVNTTTARAPHLRSPQAKESGGLSGAPLKPRALDVLSLISKMAKGRLGIISTGGVMTPEDIFERLKMGADLVEVYTGLVYAGPALVREGLKLLEKNALEANSLL